MPIQTNSLNYKTPDTTISSLDGGLRYRGYAVEDLVEKSSFLEVASLVVWGELPTHEQTADMEAVMAEAGVLETDIQQWIERIPLNVPTIDVMRTGVNLIALADECDEESTPPMVWDCLQKMLAQLPLFMAERSRCSRDVPRVTFRDDLSYEANLLLLLTGKEPTPTAERACRAFLIVAAEHELAPSTFATRIVASTRSDFFSAVIAGMCTIKGIWHGGPGRQIIDILEAVAQPESAPAIVRAVLQQYERLPGFWHRVYRTSDPRAEMLTAFCRELAEERGLIKLEDVAAAIESSVWDEQQVLPCLDWPAARLLHYLGLDADMFIPMFALSRMVGWAAHYIEQQQSPQPIRPRATYVGSEPREFEGLDERG